MGALTALLYSISTALLVPVILALLGMLAWTLVLAGGFLREWAVRRSVRDGLLRACALAAGGTADREAARRALSEIPHGLPARFVKTSGSGDRVVLRKALDDLECAVASAMSRLSFLTRVGPMLGLMGTLIPLGPALTSLAAGNVQELSSNLIVAFTTTVIGLTISGTAYGMALARRVWYTRDMTDLEFLAERLHEGME